MEKDKKTKDIDNLAKLKALQQAIDEVFTKNGFIMEEAHDEGFSFTTSSKPLDEEDEKEK